MSSRNRAFSIVVIGAIAAGTILLLYYKAKPVVRMTDLVRHAAVRPANTVSIRKRPSDVSKGDASDGRHGASMGTLSRSAHFFPAQTPVAQMYDALKQAADAGNPRAQCRLGAELGRCAAVLEKERLLDEKIANASMLKAHSTAEQGAVREIAAETQALSQLAGVCRGVTPEQARNGWKYEFRAAKHGNVQAMLAFSINPPLSESNFSGDLEGWKAYRDNAVAMLEQAARKGSPLAFNQLAWIYANYPIAGGSPLVPKDPARAIANATVARMFADESSSRQLQRMMARLQSEAGLDATQTAAAVVVNMQASMNMQPGARVNFVDNSFPLPEDCDK